MNVIIEKIYIDESCDTLSQAKALAPHDQSMLYFIYECNKCQEKCQICLAVMNEAIDIDRHYIIDNVKERLVMSLI